MDDLTITEESYNNYINNLNFWLPEGIIEVDISVLQKFSLLNFFNKKPINDETLTRYFQIIESNEKITLINNFFIVWIVPENINDTPTTYTLIALNNNEQPHLELAFSTSGVYNTSKLVLRILEKYLIEIQENEELLKNIQKAS